MLRYVFDTNIFRYAQGNTAFRTRIEAYSPLSYSSVVLSELRRSAVNEAARLRLDAIQSKATRPETLVVPTHRDWQDAGEFLGTKVPANGHVTNELLTHLRKAQNDALIAFSCWARGFTVVTCNGGDFDELRAFWRAENSRLIVEPAPTRVAP